MVNRPKPCEVEIKAATGSPHPVIGICFWCFSGAARGSGCRPRRNPGGTEPDRPRLAPRALSCHALGSGWSIRRTGRRCQGKSWGGPDRTRIGTRPDPAAHGGVRPGSRPLLRCGEWTRLRRPVAATTATGAPLRVGRGPARARARDGPGSSGWPGAERIPRDKQRPITFLRTLAARIKECNPHVAHCWLSSGNIGGAMGGNNSRRQTYYSRLSKLQSPPRIDFTKLFSKTDRAFSIARSISQ